MWVYLGLGLSMGLSAGISPGPLLALVITASLRSGSVGGFWVALAPLITDLPIITLSVVLVRYLPPVALRWLGVVGGVVVIWMGIETIRSARKATLSTGARAQANPQQELWRGVLVNVLNPHPYLFWATVGGPALVSGWRVSPWYALGFIVPFYALLVGSKMFVAWLFGHHSLGLSLTWYRRVLMACGVLLLAAGGWLIWQAQAG
jgi:threonine/homoserine/homoserine lactone efflux protein